MRLVDADKLIEEGWVLHRHGESNRLLTTKSIADVPTAFDIESTLKDLNTEYINYGYRVLQSSDASYVRLGISKAINIIKRYLK